jgi:hypothetical protein
MTNGNARTRPIIHIKIIITRDVHVFIFDLQVLQIAVYLEVKNEAKFIIYNLNIQYFWF